MNTEPVYHQQQLLNYWSTVITQTLTVALPLDQDYIICPNVPSKVCLKNETARKIIMRYICGLIEEQ